MALQHQGGYRFVDGPWLLNEGALRDLEQVFATLAHSLQELRAREIEQLRSEETAYLRREPQESEEAFSERVDRAVLKLVQPVTTRWALTLTHDTLATFDTLDEALGSLEVKDRRVLEVCVRSTYKRNQVEVSVGNTRCTAHADAYPKGVEQEAYRLLNGWIAGHRPSLLRRGWSGLAFLARILLGVCAFFALMFTFAPPGTKRVLDHSTLSTQAEDLVKAGINQSNRDIAVELLLRKEFDLVPSTVQTRELPPRAWAILAVVSLVLGMLAIAPGFTVAIGSGRRGYERWMAWQNFVAYTVPALVFSTWIWPFAVEMLGRALGGTRELVVVNWRPPNGVEFSGDGPPDGEASKTAAPRPSSVRSDYHNLAGPRTQRSREALSGPSFAATQSWAPSHRTALPSASGSSS